MALRVFSFFVYVLVLSFMLFACSENPAGDSDNDESDTATSTVSFPITFEEDLPWKDFIINYFNLSIAVIENPHQEGINTSNKVAKVTLSTSEFAPPDRGSDIMLADKIDFTDDIEFIISLFAVKSPTRLFFKISNEDATESIVAGTVIREQQEWVDITLSPGCVNQSTNYNVLTVDFNPRKFVPETTDTWYIDNIRQQVRKPLTLPLTFDDETLNYRLRNTFRHRSEIVADPTDLSNKVVQTVSSIKIGPITGIGGYNSNAGLDNPIPFTNSDTSMSIRVMSPAAGIPVRLQLESECDPSIYVVTETTTTTASEWETLVFDFTNVVPGTPALNLSNEYKSAGIHFNPYFGPDNGDTVEEQTFFWDDLKFGDGQ